MERATVVLSTKDCAERDRLELRLGVDAGKVLLEVGVRGGGEAAREIVAGEQLRGEDEEKLREGRNVGDCGQAASWRGGTHDERRRGDNAAAIDVCRNGGGDLGLLREGG